jgi:hypothetical protein
MLAAQVFDQNLRDEILRRGRGQCPVKSKHHGLLNAKGCKFEGLIAQRQKPGGCLIWLKEAAWVRMKAEHAG